MQHVIDSDRPEPRRARRCLAAAICAGIMLALGAPPAWAQAQQPQSDDTAQFQMRPTAPAAAAPSPWTFTFGTESRASLTQNLDLNKSVKDDVGILEPELNAMVIYRPAPWFEGTLRMLLSREIPFREEDAVPLPGGGVRLKPKRHNSLETDEANVHFKGILDTFGFQVGRRNYEDDRHWLYDQSLDAALISAQRDKLMLQYSKSRARLVDLDILRRDPRDRINNDIFFLEYRGIEDHKLNAYTVYRDDRNNREGRPVLLGARSMGSFLMGDLSYWGDLATVRGSDETSQTLSGWAFDVGATYRFDYAPMNPNITLGYAYATGDKRADDNKNNEFRQTGLHSNETRYAGVSDFKIYGEAFDPELSNLKILSAGLGFRPTRDFSVDFVFHRYWLQTFAESLRNTAVVAEMNQNPNSLSRELGDEFDIVLGMRNLFGVRRLGLDIRAGFFFPGPAFQVDLGNDVYRDADTAFATNVKIYYEF
jgi:alginate production protein